MNSRTRSRTQCWTPACTETPQLMPAPITYAHRILQHAADLRKNESAPSKTYVGSTMVNIPKGLQRVLTVTERSRR